MPSDRKNYPVFSGVIKYFPDAMLELARCSKAGNDQHHPDLPLHWDRTKSNDHLDALVRHLIQSGQIDDDGILHTVKVAWRALAAAQIEIEKRGQREILKDIIKADEKDGLYDEPFNTK